MLFSYHRIISTSLVSNKQKITCYLSYSCCQIRILSMGLTYCPSPICLLLCKVIMTVWLYIILLSTRLFSKKINTRKWKSDLSWNYLIYFPLEVITETLDGASCVLVIRKCERFLLLTPIDQSESSIPSGVVTCPFFTTMIYLRNSNNLKVYFRAMS